MLKIGSPLDTLIEAARAASNPADMASAEQAFYKALTEATVYAHVPAEPTPPDRIRFIQCMRPDNGQTVLPFFSDRGQAETAGNGTAAIVAMAGRRLFELTRGATLMLNPNRDQLTFYPPEIGALLEGRSLGLFTRESLEADEQVGGVPAIRADGYFGASTVRLIRTRTFCAICQPGRGSPRPQQRGRFFVAHFGGDKGE